jgi:hypothetical protein
MLLQTHYWLALLFVLSASCFVAAQRECWTPGKFFSRSALCLVCTPVRVLLFRSPNRYPLVPAATRLPDHSYTAQGWFCPGDDNRYYCPEVREQAAVLQRQLKRHLITHHLPHANLQGTYNPLTGSKSSLDCLFCPAGTSQRGTGVSSNSSCNPCAAGLFSPSPGAAFCTPCPEVRSFCFRWARVKQPS